MAEYIPKAAVVAEIENKIKKYYKRGEESDVLQDGNAKYWGGVLSCLNEVKTLIDTLEVKEVGISILNIDDTLKEEGFDPDSKEAKVFKESYYMALEKLKAQKGEIDYE